MNAASTMTFSCPRCRHNRLKIEMLERVADEARAQGAVLQQPTYLLKLLALVEAVEIGHRPHHAHHNCCVCIALRELHDTELLLSHNSQEVDHG